MTRINRITRPSKRDQHETLNVVYLGKKGRVRVVYDHGSDNYEITHVSNDGDVTYLWGSDGLNVHEYAEGVLGAIINTMQRPRGHHQ